ncbi:hypothetical protein M752DRAFT_77724 [Aspergillus phoenicis ATCC 13157]|uniref:Uncharacterized protein n=1 Tax=Aspergillus phoenicis ATCC 13157 TaxID=1353007 RepID=A0A370P7W7_ASPPH|nr:hypothetical protein M752DRAFT_77724 [Aspergillus phoenicis ATCC 13157]
MKLCRYFMPPDIRGHLPVGNELENYWAAFHQTNLPGRCENYSISSFLRSYAEGSSTNYPQYEWRNTRVNRVLNIACGLAILSTNPIEKTSRKSNLPSDRLSRTYHGLNLRPMLFEGLKRCTQG